ncbi:MAG: tetratricopeptide repeat protein [Anaerolineaceae bacterium]|nr:tetratricopeptide repeat protein [Anaerolineaceae bacterium]MCB9097968.1 tetratricopeptide repeat protein [Anaerolineales bacterium]
MTDRLEIYLLGGLTIKKNGEPVEGLVSRKAEALLAYLVCTGRPQSRETLGDMFWDDRSQTKALGNLRVLLTSLRQHLGDYLDINRQTVTFNLASNYRLDVVELTKAMEGVKPEEMGSEQLPTVTVTRLEQAIELYRGDFLAGFNLRDAQRFEEWARFEREQLQQLAIEALRLLVSFYLRTGNYQAGLKYATQLTEIDSFSEEAHRQMMLLLIRTGQRNAALRQYETCRQILADELGVEPMDETTRLYRRIRSISTVGAHNLPMQSTPFVGRTAELMLLGSYLTHPDIRVVTLVGPGGIGKTRLGVQAALENRTVFLNGVCFVPLASVQSPDFLVPAMVEALQISVTNSEQPKAQLLDHLANRELLLFWDNFEHLVDGGIDLLVDILQAAPEIKLLITTRERLNLLGEQVFEVGGLPIPQDQNDDIMTHSAVQLFLQSAFSTRVGFETNAADLAQIVRICRLVEGMPLAIELAAAWVHILSCREIATEIERNLGALSAPTRNIPQRHRSLRAVCDYSWQLLVDDERQTFPKFGVFVGKFDREAAQRVTGVSLLTLSGLVDKSLLRKSSTEQYDIHELLRQYASKKLAEDPAELEATLDRHASYYASLASRYGYPSDRDQKQTGLTAFETALDNILAAWQWSLIRGRYQDLNTLLDGLFLFYQNYGRMWEGANLFERAITDLELQSPGLEIGQQKELRRLLGALLIRQGQLFYRLAAYREAEEKLQQGVDLLRLLDEKSELALGLEQLGALQHGLGLYAAAQEQLQASFDLWSALNNRRGMARVKNELGNLALAMGQYQVAETLFQAALQLHQKLSSIAGMALSLNYMGNLAYRLNHPHQAQAQYREALELCESNNDPLGQVYVLNNLGALALAADDHEAAARYFYPALRYAHQLQIINLMMLILDKLSLLLQTQGHYERAYALAVYVAEYPQVILLDPAFMTDQPCVEHSHDVRDCAAQRCLDLQSLLTPKLLAAAEKRYKNWELAEVIADVIRLDPQLMLKDAS